MTQYNHDFEYRAGALYWAKPRKGIRVGDEAGTVSHYGYRIIGYNGQDLRRARIVWEMHNGPIPVGYEVDHINGDRLDDRLENLRLATSSQNTCNQGLRKDNTSGFKGIRWEEPRGRWRVYCAVNGKRVNRYTRTLDEAVAMLKQLRPELHGEFMNHGDYNERL